MKRSELLKKKESFRRFLRNDNGQALVEYILLAVVSISVVATLKNLISDLTVKIWQALGKRIAAPCPIVDNCDPGADFDI